jgi:hypothetical protein
MRRDNGAAADGPDRKVEDGRRGAGAFRCSAAATRSAGRGRAGRRLRNERCAWLSGRAQNWAESLSASSLQANSGRRLVTLCNAARRRPARCPTAAAAKVFVSHTHFASSRRPNSTCCLRRSDSSGAFCERGSSGKQNMNAHTQAPKTT